MSTGPVAMDEAAVACPDRGHEAASRHVCARCERPLRTCLCAWIRPTDNRMAVQLWMHPDEVGQAKGSATLLRLSLAQCALHVSPPDALNAPLPDGWLDEGTALLYPDGRGDARAADPSQVRRLIVLDGTWRQSRQMLRAQPALDSLPRKSLPPDLLAAHGQRYRVRKAHKPGQLSTLEAVALALRHLDPTADSDAMGHAGHTADRYGPLLHAFDDWVDSLSAWSSPALSPARPANASPAG
jgi:DTW domain-containing protein YfiP